MGKAVVIISGGMDSTTLLYDVLAGVSASKDFADAEGSAKQNEMTEVHALSFDYGQRHVKELDSAVATTAVLGVPHQIVDMKAIGHQLLKGSSLTDDIDVPEGHYEEESMKLTVVPNRNMIMLSLAIGYAVSIKADAVYYGAHAGDHAIYPDCWREFVDAMQVVAGLCDWRKVKLLAPYIDKDKGDIAIRGKELDVDYALTWTCYQGKDLACGKCGACQERLEAFAKAEIKDPIAYAK